MRKDGFRRCHEEKRNKSCRSVKKKNNGVFKMSV